MRCNDLQITTTGRIIENKHTWENIYNVFELIEQKQCTECKERYNCKLLQCLEENICL